MTAWQNQILGLASHLVCLYVYADNSVDQSLLVYVIYILFHVIDKF